jgi:hypothetical protein
LAPPRRRQILTSWSAKSTSSGVFTSSALGITAGPADRTDITTSISTGTAAIPPSSHAVALSKSSLTGTVAASSSAVDRPEWQAVARAYIRRGVRGVRDPRVHRALQLIASDHSHAEIAADLGMSVAYLDGP